MSQEEITRQIKMAALRAGLDAAGEDIPGSGRGAGPMAWRLSRVLGQALNRVQKKLGGSAPWTMRDWRKIAAATGHRPKLERDPTRWRGGILSAEESDAQQGEEIAGGFYDETGA